MEELDFGIKTMTNKFSTVLSYFGEDASMAPQVFFSILRRFMADFVESREVVERQKKLEERREREAAKKAAAALLAVEESASAHDRFGSYNSGKVFSMEDEIASSAAAIAPPGAGSVPKKVMRRSSIM